MPGVQRIGGAMRVLVRVAGVEAVEIQPDGRPPMLEFDIDDGWLVPWLTRTEVEQLRDALTDWLERP
jgi:hypothetical protein